MYLLMKKDRNRFFFLHRGPKIHFVFVCSYFMIHTVKKSLHISAVTLVSMVLNINTVAMAYLMNS